MSDDPTAPFSAAGTGTSASPRSATLEGGRRGVSHHLRVPQSSPSSPSSWAVLVRLRGICHR
ncbi:MAG: hypothetical protein U1U88_001911 [Lawsonella clevelandensis]